MDKSLSPVVVRVLETGDVFENTRWDEFVLSCPVATFFHRAGWQRIIKNILKHETYYLYASVEGRIVGVLPLAHISSLFFGKSLVSLPFAVYAGIASESLDAFEALQREAQKISMALDVDYLEFRNVDAHNPTWPAQDIYVTFRKEISGSCESNLLAIPRKQRAMIRKGMKNGLRSEVDINVDRFYDMYADNMHRHGTPPLSKAYFSALLTEFGSACEIMTIVEASLKPVSSVLSFYFRDEVLPYYAGDFEVARDLAANDFKYWELLRRFCLRGGKVFDFGRSKVGTGSFAFKTNWGFESKLLNYEFCLYKKNKIPQNNPLNSKFKILINVWRRLPIVVVNTIGPYIVRNLG